MARVPGEPTTADYKRMHETMRAALYWTRPGMLASDLAMLAQEVSDDIGTLVRDGARVPDGAYINDAQARGLEVLAGACETAEEEADDATDSYEDDDEPDDEPQSDERD